jgi:hypothetical protein
VCLGWIDLNLAAALELHWRSWQTDNFGLRFLRSLNNTV